MSIICKELIVSELTLRGEGTTLSPYRRIVQVFEKDGTLIAEKDPLPETFSFMDLIHFHKWCVENNRDNPSKEDVNNWLTSIK